MINKLISSAHKTKCPPSTFKEGHLFILKTEEVQEPSPAVFHILALCMRKYINVV
jgi:hypothetical protein